MSFVDTRFIEKAGIRLERFKHQGGTYNCRCPYCGDSQKQKSKARGYFFPRNADYFYKCHNCGISKSVHRFLKDHAPDLYAEYLLEKYRKPIRPKEKPLDLSARPKFAKKVSGLTPISELNTGHPAREFLEKRQIPEESFASLFYTDRFKRWVNSQLPNYIENLQNDRPRIIIPLIDETGRWFGVQGRSLAPKSNLRYVTILFDKDRPKLYGIDRVNSDEEVYVTEGPFDSHFLVNAIAMCGSDVDLSGYDHRFIFVFDNEPRSREIVSKISKTIDQGHKVVIFPKEIKEKDLNDMVLAGRDVKSIVKDNTYQGMEAKVKLTFWKKV